MFIQYVRLHRMLVRVCAGEDARARGGTGEGATGSDRAAREKSMQV